MTSASYPHYTIEELRPEAQSAGEQMRAVLEEIISLTPHSLWYEANWKQVLRLVRNLTERYWQLHQEMKEATQIPIIRDEAQGIRPEPKGCM